MWNKCNKYFKLHVINEETDAHGILKCIFALLSLSYVFWDLTIFFWGIILCPLSHIFQIRAAIILHDFILLATRITLRWLHVLCWTNITHSLATVILEPVNSLIKPFLSCNLKWEPWEKKGKIVRGEVKSWQRQCS